MVAENHRSSKTSYGRRLLYIAALYNEGCRARSGSLLARSLLCPEMKPWRQDQITFIFRTRPKARAPNLGQLNLL